MNRLPTLPSGHQLIGRDAELDRVARLLDPQPHHSRSDDGRPASRAALVITGARGCGKSSLLAAGAQLALRAGRHRVLRLHGAGPAGLRPLRQMLLAVRHELPGLPPPVGRPALALLGLDQGTALPDPAALPVVVRAAVTAVAATSPFLIVADDLHELDPEVLTLLAGLAGTPGIAVLAASRTPVPSGPAAMPVLELAPLDADAAARLFADRNPVTTAQQRAEILHLSAGNPAAIVELAHSVPPCGGLLAETTQTLLGLPARTRTLLLRAAAMLPGDPALLHPATDATDATGSDWQPAVNAGLVTFTPAGLAFTHPLAAEAAYRAVPAHQRLQARRELATVLSAHPEHQALQLTALPGADERIAAAAEDAAAIFRARGARYEAATAVRRAALRSPSPAEAARRLVQAITDVAELRDIAWVTELHTELWQLTDDPDLLAAAAAPVIAALLDAGRHRQAYAILLATHGAGPAADSRHALNLAVMAASIAWLTGEPEHRAGLIRLLDAADPATDPVAAALVRTVIDPSTHAGRHYCETATVPGPGSGISRAERTRLTHLGLIAWIEDHSRLAVAALTSAVDADPRPPRLPSPGHGTTIALITCLIDSGDWERAARYADDRDSDRLPSFRASLASLRAQLHALQGDNEAALRIAQQAWQQLDVRENLVTHLRLLRAAGLACAGNGDHADAYRHLRAMFEPDGRPLHPYLSARSIADLVHAAVRCDKHDDARTVADEVRHAAGERPGARMTILLDLAEALLASDADAEKHFRAAAEEPAGTEWRYEHALAHLHYGAWLRRRRSPREARTVLTYAEKIFTELGARGAAQIAAREIAVGSQPIRLGGRFAGATLTPQEQQVAALAAQGLTNRAIAEQLFISARTVSTHLSRVYNKTGIRSRHELSA
ncbi:LuxR family transcriptional regulator [Actinoplanes missouriensis]|uniref:helix-turn-helix transcriptional regulator n=1 Tax=Actinoplanes missouriensis TaxID=1866 RepID=UPI0033D65CFA